MAYKASQAWQNPEIQGASLAKPQQIPGLTLIFAAQNEIYDACICILKKIYYIVYIKLKKYTRNKIRY